MCVLILTTPLIFIGGSHELHRSLLQLCLAKPPSRTNEQVTRQRGESVEPWWARPTMLVGRWPTRPHRLQLPLVGRHVSPYPYCKCLSFGYVSFLLHVGPLIHVRLNGALWLVDVFCLGLRSVFPFSWSVFSLLIHQHTNIHQHLWKLSVINPYH